MLNTEMKCLYLCECYRFGNHKERMQAIFYPKSNKIIVGYDAWRLLDHADYPSYTTFTYYHFSDFIKDYEIIGANQEDLLGSIRKSLIPYYPKKKKRRCSTYGLRKNGSRLG